MGSLLAVAAGMRTLGLLITLLAAAPQAATDQKLAVPEGTVITSAQVTGFDIDRLSPGLRQDIRNLAGTPLKQERLDELAARIEAERPRYVAAVRTVMDPDGQARVFFVVGRQDEPDRDDNVNARYIVEQADITGVPDAELTQALRDDLQALVGKRLDSGDADRLQERIERELPRLRGVPAHRSAGARLAASGSSTRRARRSRHLAAVRAAAIERPLSLRPGLGQLPGPRHRRPDDPVHANLRHRQRGRSRRGVLRLRAALRNEEAGHPAARRQLRVVLVRCRTGVTPRWTRSRCNPEIPAAVRHAIDDHAAAEVCVQPGPQRRRRA